MNRRHPVIPVLCLSMILVAAAIESSAIGDEIHTAAQSGNTKTIAKLLADKPGLINTKDSSGNGYTALHWAVNNSQEKAVELLLEKGADPNVKSQYNYSPLHLAAMRNNDKIIQLLLQKKADVNAIDQSKQTPLVYAIQYSRSVGAVEKMIEAGAKFKATTPYGQTYFTMACQYGRGDIAEALIKHGIDVDKRDSNGNTALMMSASSNQIKLVKTLIAKGCDVNQTNKSGRNTLHFASQSASKELIDLVVKHIKKVDVADNNGVTPLYGAVQRNDVKIVKNLIDHGADPARSCRDNMTSPLHFAAANANLEMVELLVKHKSLVNQPDGQKEYAIHYAARGGYPQWQPQTDEARMKLLGRITKTLLDAGARADVKNSQNQSPLEMAINHRNFLAADAIIGKLDTVDIKKIDAGESLMHWAARNGLINSLNRLLEKLKSGANDVDEEGRTPFFLGCMNGHADVVTALMKYKPDLDLKDVNGETALMVAAWNGKADIVQQLIKAGANLYEKDNSGQSALHLASWNGHAKVVDEFLDADAETDQVTSSGYTPLHAAAWKGHANVINQLAKKGVSLDVKDSDGMTPLHKAAHQGHLDAVKALVAAGADIGVKDSLGYDALSKAKSQKKDEVVKFLESKLK